MAFCKQTADFVIFFDHPFLKNLFFPDCLKVIVAVIVSKQSVEHLPVQACNIFSHILVFPE